MRHVLISVLLQKRIIQYSIKNILIKQNNYVLIKNGKSNRAKFIGYESLTDERYSDIIVTISYFR